MVVSLRLAWTLAAFHSLSLTLTVRIGVSLLIYSFPKKHSVMVPQQ
jgi:hypothetical protein